MSTIRTKIVVFWGLFFLFCLLVGLWWSHRLLWLGLFLPALIIVSLIKPQVPQPPKLKLLFGLALFVFLFAFVVHGLLFPESADLYLLMKVLCPLSLAPALCYKAYSDYVVFQCSDSESA